MTYNAEVQFKFDATFTPTYGSSSWSDDDFIPEEHYLITAPAADLNCKQYFKLFEKFLLCVGMDPKTIRSSAMSLVFNDCIDEAEQRKICAEYELTMDEDLRSKFEDFKKADEEWARLKPGPMGTVDTVGRYSIFTQFTDSQLKEMAEWGNQKYFIGED
jgi:hypothetical protein